MIKRRSVNAFESECSPLSALAVLADNSNVGLSCGSSGAMLLCVQTHTHSHARALAFTGFNNPIKFTISEIYSKLRFKNLRKMKMCDVRRAAWHGDNNEDVYILIASKRVPNLSIKYKSLENPRWQRFALPFAPFAECAYALHSQENDIASHLKWNGCAVRTGQPFHVKNVRAMASK